MTYVIQKIDWVSDCCKAKIYITPFKQSPCCDNCKLECRLYKEFKSSDDIFEIVDFGFHKK